MNIDYLANLIESSDVSTFRTLATHFVRSIGYPRGFLSDGSYDGGADFFVYHNEKNGIQTAFQLSIENKWKTKLEKDFVKAKTNYPEIKAFIFVSKRRIPFASIRKVNTELIQKYGMAATHYDNQAIATEFIDKNLVGKLYEALGIPAPPAPPAALTTPAVEAAASLLVFGIQSGDFRSEMIENIVLTELREMQPATETALAMKILHTHSLPEAQRKDILRAIRHSVAEKRIDSMSGELEVSRAVRLQQDGLRTLANGEFAALKRSVEDFLRGIQLSNQTLPVNEILEDFLSLAMGLWRRFAPHRTTIKANEVDDTFYRVNGLLNGCLGAVGSRRALTGLADIVGKSDFAKRLAAAELYYSLVRTSSTQLVTALGETKGLFVLFDTSVLIPILCGLLFDKVDDHPAYSARLLIDLLRQHQFTAQAPNLYVEEVAAHLVDCCRNYQALLLAGEDLSFSSNAFASHFSQLRKTEDAEAWCFDDYIATFGSPPGARYSDLSDNFYYPTIEKIGTKISAIFERYSIKHLQLDNKRFDRVAQRINDSLTASGGTRAPLLIAHDARIVGYLESPTVEAGFAKVLCTWDSIQFKLNPIWDTYCVMNPASVIDILTLLRSDTHRGPMAQLVDYVWMQNESAMKLSAIVWDEIVAIEKGSLSDAILLAKARAFRLKFIESHADDSKVDTEAVGSLWLKWKRSEQTF